jgi:hypothetical protein
MNRRETRREETMTHVVSDLRSALDGTCDEIQWLADEIRVKLHLANMDAKDTWRKLEPEIARARQHAHEATDSSSEAIQDILDAFKKFHASL